MTNCNRGAVPPGPLGDMPRCSPAPAWALATGAGLGVWRALVTSGGVVVWVRTPWVTALEGKRSPRCRGIPASSGGVYHPAGKVPDVSYAYRCETCNALPWWRVDLEPRNPGGVQGAGHPAP